MAIDFPLNRLDVSLVRDMRMYQLITKSNLDRTEYLGVRHSPGFCKLYNKTIESNLDYNLTRFEITLCSTFYNLFLTKMPKLLLFGNSQMTFDILNTLSQNQTVMLELLLLHPDYLQKLDKRGRLKYKACFDKLSQDYIVPEHCFNYLAERVRGYISLEILR